MTTQEIKLLSQVWSNFPTKNAVPHNQDEYTKLVTFLDVLIDEVGENENHPLASLMELISLSVETYENHNVPKLMSNPDC